MTDLLISELYDKLTYQGEGQSLGQLCSFIRTFGCGLFCRWCDSAFSWRVSDEHPHDFAPVYDPKLESRRMSIETIVDHFREMNPPMMVITGGEPMLQAKKLPELMTALINEIPALTRIEIETAGTIWNDEVAEFPFVWFNVSPKLENSGNPKDLRYKPDVLKSFVDSNAAVFKFVVCDDKDLDEIQEIVDEVGIPEHKVYIMPEGISENVQRERLQYLADEVLKRRWNLTIRLHVLLWGAKRGV
jgi:organic radical activating enzyme